MIPACELTNKGVAAIFGPQSVETRGIVESICEAMEIPHIQTTWVPSPPPLDRMGKMAVKFYPNQQNLSSALSALISDYDWKTYTILYEDDSGLFNFYLDVLQNRLLLVVARYYRSKMFGFDKEQRVVFEAFRS